MFSLLFQFQIVMLLAAYYSTFVFCFQFLFEYLNLCLLVINKKTALPRLEASRAIEGYLMCQSLRCGTLYTIFTPISHEATVL